MQENKSQGYRRLSLAPPMAENNLYLYLGTSERAWIWFATLTLPWICLTADIDPAVRHTGTRDGCPSSRHVGETTPRVPTQYLSRGTAVELVILLGVREVGCPQRSPS